MLIFFMYGINLQLFNSKLRISIFDNLPKITFCVKLAVLRKKNCAKLKFRFMRNFHKKYFRFCANCAKKERKTHCVPCAKIAQKFAKKKICANFAQKI